MPIQYSGILDEHRATRENAGLFDVSHMGEFLVTGDQAEAFLDYIITNDLSRIEDGQALYSTACYEHGGVVDDLILYRLSGKKFFICCNASNMTKVEAWLQENEGAFACSVENVSANYAQLAVQGPNATNILELVFPDCSMSINRFRFIESEAFGHPFLLSRTGYTGEDGFEIYLPPAGAPLFAAAILETGNHFGLKLVGLGARDSLRLEAGLPLYGHEISEEISPIEGGLGWTVKFGKASDFIGKAALLRRREDPCARRVIHFTSTEKRIARQGSRVFAGKEDIGEVLSGTYSPMTEGAIGSALVEMEKVAHDTLFAEVRGNRLHIQRAKPPLHKSI